MVFPLVQILLILGVGGYFLSQGSKFSESGGLTNALFGKSRKEIDIEQQEKQDAKNEQDYRDERGVFGNTSDFFFGKSSKPTGKNTSNKGNA